VNWNSFLLGECGNRLSKVLVVGAAGFIGSHIVDQLLADPSIDQVVALDNESMGNQLPLEALASPRLAFVKMDCTKPNELNEIIGEFGPNRIYHLAANSDIGKGSQDSSFDLSSTFATTASLATALSLARLKVRPQLIFASTSAIFGEVQGEISEMSRRKPQSAYGWMKLASEKLLETIYDAGALGALLTVRFPNVTGARQTHGVVKDLVRKYFDDQHEWKVLGNGTQSKPYIHAVTLAKLMERLSNQAPEGSREAINLAPQDNMSVGQIVQTIQNLGPLDRTPVFGSSPLGWEGDVAHYSYDTSRLHSMGIVIESSRKAVEKSVLEEFSLYV